MCAKGNQLADAATKLAGFNTHPVQSQEYPLLSIHPAKPLQDFLLKAQEIATKGGKQIGKHKG